MNANAELTHTKRRDLRRWLLGVVVVIGVMGLVAGERLWRDSQAPVTHGKPLPTASGLHVRFVAMVPRKLPDGWAYIGADHPSEPDFTYMQFAHGQQPMDLMEATAGGHPSLQQSGTKGKHEAGQFTINGRTWTLYQPGSVLITQTNDHVVVLLRGLSTAEEREFASTLQRSIRTVSS